MPSPEACGREIERMQDERIAELEHEVDRLRDALTKIARPGYGLQSIQEEYPDANAYNYHAMKYWSDQALWYQKVARAALSNERPDHD